MHQANTTSLELNRWGQPSNENRLFTQLTWFFLIITLIFAIIVKMITVPELTREEKAKIPPQLTKFIERVKIEEKPKPKPVEVKKEEATEEVITPKVEPKLEPKVEPVVKTQEQKVAVAVQQAKNSGLLAMQDDLAQLREIAQMTQMTLPSNDQVLSNEGSQAAIVDVAPSGDNFAAQAASLDSIKVSQTVGQRVDLAKRELTTVAQKEVSPEETEGLVQEQENFIAGGRDVESIRKVLDRNKGAFYTIYRRALRKDPSLEGKVEMLIVVAPNGSIAKCSILFSELNSPVLERKLLARIRLINFGAQSVDETSINYSFNFLPF